MSILLAAAGGLVLTYLLLLAALLAARPKGNLLAEALRMLPDLLGLLHRLAVDRSLPRGVRVRLWLLFGYLAMPFDLVPDFVPVLGYADDAIVVSLVLRSTVRRAGGSALRRHWRGSEAGLVAASRLAGVPVSLGAPSGHLERAGAGAAERDGGPGGHEVVQHEQLDERERL